MQKGSLVKIRSSFSRDGFIPYNCKDTYVVQSVMVCPISDKHYIELRPTEYLILLYEEKDLIEIPYPIKTIRK